MKKFCFMTALFIGVIALCTGPAVADKTAKGHLKSGYAKESGPAHKKHSAQQADEDDDVIVQIRIGDDDRTRIKGLMREDALRNCPPGLAKKNPPCVPPGQAKKWRMGQTLTGDFVPVPAGWGLRAPDGYQYVKVDKDILLIAEATKKVIDAVTLISAVGK